jgi:hypothetical protein
MAAEEQIEGDIYAEGGDLVEEEQQYAEEIPIEGGEGGSLPAEVRDRLKRKQGSGPRFAWALMEIWRLILVPTFKSHSQKACCDGCDLICHRRSWRP